MDDNTPVLRKRSDVTDFTVPAARHDTLSVGAVTCDPGVHARLRGFLHHTVRGGTVDIPPIRAPALAGGEDEAVIRGPEIGSKS